MSHDIDFFRKEYARQKKMEAFIQARVLSRPNTKKWYVIVACIGFVLSVVMAVVAVLVIDMSKSLQVLSLSLALLVLIEVYLRFCLIQGVKCYQHYATDEVRRRCLCIPSCSEYAILCLKIFPLTIALIKIRKRLYKTCKGEDYKLDFPCKRMNKQFEKRYL